MDLSRISCSDYTYFKERLDQLRKSDDQITHRLNSLVDRSSLDKEIESCGALFTQLKKGHIDRIQLIRRCVDETEREVIHLKQHIEELHTTGKEKEEFNVTQSLRRLQHRVSKGEIIRRTSL
jgi:hypothetical protein